MYGYMGTPQHQITNNSHKAVTIPHLFSPFTLAGLGRIPSPATPPTKTQKQNTMINIHLHPPYQRLAAGIPAARHFFLQRKRRF